MLSLQHAVPQTRAHSDTEQSLRRLRLFPAQPEGKLAGKSIAVSIDNPDYSGMKDVIKDCADLHFPYSRLKTYSFSSLLIALPEMKTDVLVILSPRLVRYSMDALEDGLKAFRKNNPSSIVLINNLHSPAAVETTMLKELSEKGLVHHIENGYIFPSRLMEKSESLMARV